MVKLNAQQIGRCGELLVQYMLLKHGVESAPLTTDPGIDLVAFADVRQKPVTIQVKTCTTRSDSDSKWVEWRVPDECPADYIATVDLDRQKFWLLSTKQFKQRGMQSGEDHSLWWYIPGHEYGKTEKREEKFEEYEMDVAIPIVFGLE